ncbi:MAG: Uma2 family endonuclease [Cyanobacteria bacterium CAN_BIN43]|nr:Uma2 family endonuclease [Cyanobacteria bacterium CAN_BIN43]
MTQAKPKFATFEEYLSYSSELEGRFQLIDGELIELPPESERNDWIALILRDWLVQIISRRRIRLGKCEIQVPVLKKGDAQNRFPDLVILREEHLQLTQRRLTITLDMPPPLLVVEVVSPGKTNRDRDYINKRAQYAAIEIEEYWIVDPTEQTVLVLELAGEEYKEVGQFQGGDSVVSITFPKLALVAQQIFQTEI